MLILTCICSAETVMAPGLTGAPADTAVDHRGPAPH